MRESIQTNSGLTIKESMTGNGVFVDIPAGPEVFMPQTRMERLARESQE